MKKMKKLLIILSAIMLLLSSCDLTGPQQPKPKMYLIACGLGYHDSPWSSLNNPISDSEAIVGQFEELCKAGGNEYEIIWYTDDLRVTKAENDSPRRFNFRHIENGVTSIPAVSLNISDAKSSITPDEFASLFFSQINELLTEQPTDNDLLIFYFSGHGDISLGKSNTGGPYLYYGTREALTIDDKLIDMNYALPICYDRLFKCLDRYKGRQFCIFDCCYSGASIDNPGHFHSMDSNELGTMDRFQENYTYDSYHEVLSRFDEKKPFSILSFMASSMDSTFDGNFQGIPKRICLNASNYAQMAMDADTKNETNVDKYGGMTYRVLKYLGYDVARQKPAPPKRLAGKVVTSNGIYKEVYDNISKELMKTSTPNITRTSYDMVLWDFR